MNVSPLDLRQQRFHTRFRGYDKIEVTWPDGKKEAFPGGPADRWLSLTPGTGSPS